MPKKLIYNQSETIIMGFYRKYNTILRTVDNVVKLYKAAKKEDKDKKEDKK